ncbi:MAG: tetratricopeptide repeat protein [Rhodospirillaceae bacterium]
MPGALPTANDKVAKLLQDAAARHRAGRLEDAEAAYRKVIKINPRNPDALHLLGLVLSQRGDAQQGIAFIRKALAVRDDFPDAHLNAARLLAEAGDLEGAVQHLRGALRYQQKPIIYCDLGNLLRAQGKDAEALAAFRSAMECSPRAVEGYVYYGRALRAVNDFSNMLAVAQAGLAIEPNNATLHIIAAEAYFGLGRLKDGWHAYRWRFGARENRPLEKNYPLPLWQGEDLAHGGILVWGEQAPGDEIMYANMFGDLLRRAKRVGIQCAPRLAPLFRRSFPEAAVFSQDLSAEELKGFDFQSAAGSLGEWLRPSFDSFPSANSYLTADVRMRDELRTKYLANSRSNLLVGISWKSTVAEAAAEKSLNLGEWGPILQVPGVTFINLQYGDCALELQEAGKGFGVSIVQDATVDPLRNMDDYAAQVAAMDLVITSSNTAAHVAGALGVPTLCLLARSLGRGRRWYWFAEHENCPWYPALRRFCRNQSGDWLEVIRQAGLALLDIVADRGTPVAPHLLAMANAFAKIGRTKDAEAYYMRLAQVEGRAAAAHTALGGLRTEALDANGAFAHYDRAIAADPQYLEGYIGKATVLNRLNRFEDAISVYKAALAQDLESPTLRSNLATSLMRLGRSQEALEELLRARAQIHLCDAYQRDAIDVNYAMALKDTGNIGEALRVLDGVLERTPAHSEAHYNRSQALLAAGQLKAGWQEAEWRLGRPNANVRYDSFPHVKRWNGADLAGKRVLIWTEQGIGDEIFIAGMIGDAIAKAAHVTVLCTPRLLSLFRRSFPKATVDIRQEPLPASARDPRLDFQMSMADLGLAFRPNFESFPLRQSYLVADEKRARALRQKYQDARPGKLLVGISWSSQGNLEMGWLKSNNLPAWQPILETPGVTFVNLQYGDRRADAALVQERFGVDILTDPDVDPTGDMDNFASQIRALDLVISISNSTVHVAGAIGVPTWVLAPERRGRHWYWFQDRNDSPWYPSLRFVRGSAGGDWNSAISRCADDLLAHVNEKSPKS